MSRIWFAAPIALCACMGSMVRAPKQIPADGNVECTDTLEMPIAATVAGAVTAGGAAYAATSSEAAIDAGGVFWIPVLAVAGVEMLFAGGLGYSYADECKVAKRRGAEVAKVARAKEAQAKARAEAGTLWKRAAVAARADDCVAVRELDPQIRELDVEFHAVVFARDVAIARCLASRE